MFTAPSDPSATGTHSVPPHCKISLTAGAVVETSLSIDISGEPLFNSPKSTKLASKLYLLLLVAASKANDNGEFVDPVFPTDNPKNCNCVPDIPAYTSS